MSLRQAPATNLDLLSRLKRGLQEVYGGRLQAVYLYGSRARGDADSDSDVDILLVLDAPGDTPAERERTNQLAADLSLAYGLVVCPVAVSGEYWQTGETPFLEIARGEAIPI